MPFLTMYLQFQLHNNIELSYVMLVTYFYSRTANKRTKLFVGQTRNENCIGF